VFVDPQADSAIAVTHPRKDIHPSNVGISRGRRPSAVCRGYAEQSTPPFDYMSDLT